MRIDRVFVDTAKHVSRIGMSGDIIDVTSDGIVTTATCGTCKLCCSDNGNDSNIETRLNFEQALCDSQIDTLRSLWSGPDAFSVRKTHMSFTRKCGLLGESGCKCDPVSTAVTRRPIDCLIFPYFVAPFGGGTVGLFVAIDCPAVFFTPIGTLFTIGYNVSLFIDRLDAAIVKRMARSNASRIGIPIGYGFHV